MEANLVRCRQSAEGNPFTGLAATVRENPKRQVFISWEDMLRVIASAPSCEWQALIAFVRLTGCRVPSELCGLLWSDIDFSRRTITIQSEKTKHHGGKHVLRSVPLFPELVPYLQALADVVKPGNHIPFKSKVFPLARHSKVNLRTPLERYVVKAGLTPWEKLFINLRSSRETELLAVYPAVDVCRWLGNTMAVAARYYAQARPEVAERASTDLTVGTVAGAPAGYIGGENGARHLPSQAVRTQQELPQSVIDQPVTMAGEGDCVSLMDRDNGRGGTRTPDIHGVNVAL